MRYFAAIAVGVLFLLQLGSCGGSGEQASTETTQDIDAPVQAYSGDWTKLKQKAGAQSDQLLIPRGPSPDEVVIKDVRTGTGGAIEPGDTFAARYVSFDYASGELDESNWKPEPWRLKWKIGELVDGWEPGLKGMKAGGLRELIVPSSLAYENGPRVYLVEVAYLERH